CSIDPEIEGTIKILLIITGAKSKYMLDAQGRSGMNTRAEQKTVPKNAQGAAPQQYQQRQRNDDEIDSVR
ncbi:MAG: cell division protein FtsZ, partial [Euryarchaeota archaeon]|nr:cell division protein FtsZ [Euryarchaeota archaeon]